MERGNTGVEIAVTPRVMSSGMEALLVAGDIAFLIQSPSELGVESA
jgi:hypothetical protein